MTCKETKENLSAFIDGELDQAGETAVAAHLKSCAGCAAELEKLRETAAVLGELDPVEMSDDAALRLATRIDTELGRRAVRVGSGEKAPRWQWLTRPAFGYVVASMAVVALAVVITWPGTLREDSLLMEGAPAPTIQEERLNKGAQTEAGSPELQRYTRAEIDELSVGAADSAGRVEGAEEEKSKSASPLPYQDAEIPSDMLTDDGALGGSTRREDGRDDSREVGVDAAVAAAADSEQATAVSAELGIFEGARVWVVVLGLETDPRRYRAAAVSIKTGKVLYRTDHSD